MEPFASFVGMIIELDEMRKQIIFDTAKETDRLRDFQPTVPHLFPLACPAHEGARRIEKACVHTGN
jgi:hypothetical protein